MPRRPDPDVLSPRAMARLRTPRAAYVPTPRELDRDPQVVRAAGLGPTGQAGGVGRVGRSDAASARRRWAEGRSGGRAVVDEPGRLARTGRHGRRLPGRGWLTLPVALEGARWQPGRSAVLGVVLVTLLAVAVFGLRVAGAQADEDGRVMAPGGGSRAGPSGVTAGAAPVGVPVGAASGGAGAAPTSSAAPGASSGVDTDPAAGGAGVVVVHVVGQVRAPGCCGWPSARGWPTRSTRRVGPRVGADLARVNLARLLVDGEQVQVPAPGTPTRSPWVEARRPRSGAVEGGGGRDVTPVRAPRPVALNTADLTSLEALPGVGPVLAQRILDWRTQHGRFSSVDELGEVSGIGEKLLAQLTPLVTL